MDLPPTFSRPGGAAPAVWCGAPPPDDEGQRLFFLRSTGLLDTTASAAFDRITRLASQIFEVPISLISLVDEQRQWFKSRVGLDVDETPREVSFCAYCVSERAPLVVPDARQDARFAGNLLVTGAPGIRFYAGAPLVLPTGHVLGSLCIIDTRPRAFSAAQLQLLQDLAALVMSQIDLHQLAGRVHEVTRLPNRAQLADDLRAACRDARAGGQCTLMLLDLMGNDQLHSAVRAIGIARLESVLRSVASQLLGWLPAGAALYHVSESRLAVLHQALAQLAAWRAQGLELTMAVNVSARNLEHPHFLRMLRNACALHDVPAPALHLECTENAVIAGTRTARVLQEVLALGVSISLDDFGVGYSNLACLHSLPVQLLKLDQSLIKPIAADVRALALVRSLILMGHSLGYRLLAEGVESAEVLDILAREGCDAAQGYHLSRPLEASAAADFLRAAPAVAALAAPVSAS